MYRFQIYVYVWQKSEWVYVHFVLLRSFFFSVNTTAWGSLPHVLSIHLQHGNECSRAANSAVCGIIHYRLVRCWIITWGDNPWTELTCKKKHCKTLSVYVPRHGIKLINWGQLIGGELSRLGFDYAFCSK